MQQSQKGPDRGPAPRVLLVGCGGVGGITAAQLLRAGCDVSIVTGNAEIRDAVRDRGLRVRELDGSEWSAVPTRPPVIRASELGSEAPFDLCLLVTKTTTLDEALADIRPLLAADGAALCLQNGLPEERAAAVLGPERVIGCVVGWGATLLGPGASAKTSRGGFQIGRLAAGPDELRLGAAARLLERAAPTKIVDNFRGVRWSKLAINCATSTLGAAGGDTLGNLLRHRFVRRLALEIWSELCAVAEKEGVRLAKVAGTLDIGRLAISDEDRRHTVGSPGLFLKHTVLWALALKFRRMRSSMAVAIERGRRPEIDWLNGEIARRGARHGIPTPLNTALVTLIHDIVARRRHPGVMTLRELYEQLASGRLGPGPKGPLALPPPSLPPPGPDITIRP